MSSFSTKYEFSSSKLYRLNLAKFTWAGLGHTWVILILLDLGRLVGLHLIKFSCLQCGADKMFNAVKSREDFFDVLILSFGISDVTNLPNSIKHCLSSTQHHFSNSRYM